MPPQFQADKPGFWLWGMGDVSRMIGALWALSAVSGCGAGVNGAGSCTVPFVAAAAGTGGSVTEVTVVTDETVTEATVTDETEGGWLADSGALAASGAVACAISA